MMHSPESSATVRPSPSSGRLWAIALLASVLAGLGSFFASESTVHYFVPPERIIVAMGVKMNVPSFADRSKADRKNASMASGILGAALGLALGLAGGLSRGAVVTGLLSGLLGGLLGLLAGAGASEAILPFYYQQLDKGSEELSKDLIVPLIIHGISWGAVGAAAGLALALGLGRKDKIAPALLGGLVGGVMGAVVYEMVGALVFPDAKTSEPLAVIWAPRLIGKLAVAILAAAMAVFAVQSPGRKPKVSAEPVAVA